mmetsp:Transcript_17359/g.65719  ORF Transcript_17359/g.65719 Transcript_17359/m.65719 type:complete len:275 (+) Transcript_17359:84-908(+)
MASACARVSAMIALWWSSATDAAVDVRVVLVDRRESGCVSSGATAGAPPAEPPSGVTPGAGPVPGAWVRASNRAMVTPSHAGTAARSPMLAVPQSVGPELHSQPVRPSRLPGGGGGSRPACGARRSAARGGWRCDCPPPRAEPALVPSAAAAAAAAPPPLWRPALLASPSIPSARAAVSAAAAAAACSGCVGWLCCTMGEPCIHQHAVSFRGASEVPAAACPAAGRSGDRWPSPARTPLAGHDGTMRVAGSHCCSAGGTTTTLQFRALLQCHMR